MRHPLWILNSTLTVLLLAAFCFIVFARDPQPEWESLEPGEKTRQIKRRTAEINIHKIYEHDLFNTYVPEVHETASPEFSVPFPMPPSPRQIEVAEEPKPSFLDPIKVTLKGIVVVLNDDTKNRAILADATTNKEELYKVGDTLEDAQLIKILNKKVIFLRANGQQEVLYLRPNDAQLDPAYTDTINWKEVVRQSNENTYIISPSEFSEKINTLGQFIDVLNLTTVYHQGVSVGCRIGSIQEGSIGYEMGLKPNDIIVKINNTPLANPENRFDIYKRIVSMQTKDTIVVELLRSNNKVELIYVLQELTTTHNKNSPGEGAQENSSIAAQQKRSASLLEERFKLAPTLRDIRERERQTMFKKGQKKNLTSNFAE